MDMRRTQGVSGAVGDTDTSMECGDWRSHLQADLRQRVINRIMETLKRHLPFSGHEGLQELKKIAVRFEEKIYTAATSQSDYLRKISLKMLTMETRSQNPMPDAMQANSGAISVNPSDPGSQVMQQVNSQGQPLPILVPSNQGQQLMQQTMHNNMGSTMHNNLSNNFSNQRQIPGRQQQQQQQQQTQNSHYVYQQQLQKIAQQKLQVQQGNIAPSMQQIQQQQQQNLLQQPSVMQPTMMQSVQNQQSVVPQSNQPLMNHQQQSALRQQQLNMMQQRIPNVGGFQQQNVIDQQKQLFQQQRPMQETSSTSLDFTLQTGNPNGGDWQEEVYQKIKVMKDLYLLDLNDMHQKILGKLQEHESLPQQPKNEQLEKLKVFKNMLERFMAFLQIPKHNIPTSYKDKLTTYEKQIVHIITSNRRKPAPTQQQPMPHKHSMQQSQHTHSSSPLLAEFSSPGGNHDVVASIGSRKSVEHVGLTDDHSFAPKFLFFLESFLVFLFIFYISVVLMSVLIV